MILCGISTALAEGYGKKHHQFRFLLLHKKVMYTTENFESLFLLQATYVAKTASILIKTLKYFVDEQVGLQHNKISNA